MSQRYHPYYYAVPPQQSYPVTPPPNYYTASPYHTQPTDPAYSHYHYTTYPSGQTPVPTIPHTPHTPSSTTTPTTPQTPAVATDLDARVKELEALVSSLELKHKSQMEEAGIKAKTLEEDKRQISLDRDKKAADSQRLHKALEVSKQSEASAIAATKRLQKELDGTIRVVQDLRHDLHKVNSVIDGRLALEDKPY
ncbi:hypothetical protein HDV00_001224, partial [Rhizophlyctis rosea]